MRTHSTRLLAIAAALISFGPPTASAQRSDPDSVQISTADIQRFFSAMTAMKSATTYRDSADVLWRDYFSPGSPGLRSFSRSRIGSPYQLLDLMAARPTYYAHLPVALHGIERNEPAIRAAFRRFKQIYPDAKFADVYFVIGRMTSAGTTGRSSILLGADMYGRDSTAPLSELDDWTRTVIVDASNLSTIAVHELMHVNQPPENGQPPLLLAVLVEGGADFLAELVTGGDVNQHVHEWAAPREAQLWAEFQPSFNKTDYSGWLYGGGKPDRPADIGYYIGYRITQAYYNRASDKVAAIHDILNITDAPAFLAKSGYNPK